MWPGLLPETKLVDLEKAWKEREKEASTLKDAGCLSMALALRVYGVEIKLKTLICKTLSLELLPDACKTHDLNRLVVFTGLWADLNDPRNAAVKANWDEIAAFCTQKLNDVRYRPAAHLSPAEVSRIEVALDEPTSGVWSWLSNRP